MRILIFTVCFPPVINGVSTRYAMTVQNLRKQGHEVVIATPVKNAPSEYFGARVVLVPGFKFPLNEFCDSEYLDIYASYCIISEVKPDIVHVCTPSWVMFGVNFWCWWKGIPVVCSYHTHVPEYARHYIPGIFGYIIATFCWWLVKLGQNTSDLSMVTSAIMGEELREHGISNAMAVWRKGVDTDLFHPCKGSLDIRKKFMPDPSKTLLLYTGRLSMEKGLPLLAKVLEDKRLRGRVHLALVGDGPIKRDLESKIFERVRSAVTFHGFMNQEDLAGVYASSDIFVFPSETETLGLVAIEAMACGLPVVGVSARGMTATVKHGETGFLYPPGDMAQCVEHIARLIDNPELRRDISWKARKDSEQWGWDKATDGLLQIYEETIAKFKASYKEKQD